MNVLVVNPLGIIKARDSVLNAIIFVLNAMHLLVMNVQCTFIIMKPIKYARNVMKIAKFAIKPHVLNVNKQINIFKD